MFSDRHQIARSGLRQTRRKALLSAVAGLVVLAVSAPFSATGAVGPRAVAHEAAGSIRPTIQYEEAVAHAGDRIAFAPGERVTVGFQPRDSDRWAVGGGTSKALPAGRLTGKAMRDVAVGADPAPSTIPTEPALPDPAPSTPADSAPSATPDPLPSVVPTPSDPTPSATELAPPDPLPIPTPTDPTPPADAPIIDPAATIHADLAAAVDPGGLRREVFGFLPYWELTDSSTRLDWEKLSTIAYFGVGAAANGDLQVKNSDGSTTVGWSGWTSSKMTSVINAAHASGTRVVLTVQSFAWSSGQVTRQKALLGSATSRLNLARQIVAAVRDRGADGVNLDFEPIVSGYGDEFTALVRTLRAEMNKVAKGYQLTFDTTGWIGNYPIETATAAGGADAVVIMGYDYRNGSSNPVGSVAPIGGPTYDITDTVKAYVARVPASKLILGVPYYGRAWSTDTNGLHAANISGAKYGASTTVVYSTARQYAIDHGRQWDPTEGVAWTAYKRENCTSTYGCVTPWRQLYYDDAQALGAKYDLINRYGLRGVGIWALGYDGTQPELYSLLKAKFITDTIPPKISASTISTPAFSPNADGRLDTVTVSLTVTGHTRFGWVIAMIADGIVGPAIRSGSTTGTTVAVTWDGKRADGSTAPDGSYQITVWTADASDNRASVAKVVALDTRPATITPSAVPIWFSPDGDGRSDRTTLRMTADTAVTGTARLISSRGMGVRTFPISAATAKAWTWDGKDARGRIVPDGRYTYRVDGLDRAGNRTIRDLTVRVDRTIRSVSWAASSFRPSAGRTDRLTFAIRRPATVTVAIYQGSTLVRRIWTGRALAAGTYGWTWNGRNSSGALVRPGKYSVVVRASSWIGPSTYTRTVTVLSP